MAGRRLKRKCAESRPWRRAGDAGNRVRGRRRGRRGRRHTGAVSVHPSYFESFTDSSTYCPRYANPSHAKLLSGERLKRAITMLGITRGTSVVVYGSGRLAPMTSARVAWALAYAGVGDVRVLDGGLAAWKAGGRPVEPAAALPAAPVEFGADVAGMPGFLATKEYVRDVVEGKRRNALLLDVRGREEYSGAKTDAYRFFSSAGHIPGAAWLGDWNIFVNPPPVQTFKGLEHLSKLWKERGITTDKELVFYCGTGWRSSMAFFISRLLGFKAVRNYDGGLYDWTWGGDGPLEVG